MVHGADLDGAILAGLGRRKTRLQQHILGVEVARQHGVRHAPGCRVLPGEFKEGVGMLDIRQTLKQGLVAATTSGP